MRIVAPLWGISTANGRDEVLARTILGPDGTLLFRIPVGGLMLHALEDTNSKTIKTIGHNLSSCFALPFGRNKLQSLQIIDYFSRNAFVKRGL